MAILLLQEQGKLSVQDSLCDFVPDCPKDFEPVTLHHLLSHSSGVPAKTLWNKPGNEMLPENVSLYFQPGEEFMYSNVGFNLLDRVSRPPPDNLMKISCRKTSLSHCR
jgi:CubicO group peptidase (beta-lactamase class C family)